MKRLAINLFLLSMLSGFAAVPVASATATHHAPSLPYAQCFADASARYKVSTELLQSIAWHESRFNPDASNTQNATPTEDIGLMQVNSWWLTNGLQRYGIGRTELLDPCTNINVGAWILATAIAQAGDVWTGVGYYNARTASKRYRYVASVQQALTDLRSGKVLAQYIKAPYKGSARGFRRSETLAALPAGSFAAFRARQEISEVGSERNANSTATKRRGFVVVSEG